MNNMQWSVVWPGVCRTFSSGTPSVKNVCPCCNWSSFNPLKYSGYESSFFSSLLRGCFHILQGSPPWTEMSKQKNYRILDWHRLKTLSHEGYQCFYMKSHHHCSLDILKRLSHRQYGRDESASKLCHLFQLFHRSTLFSSLKCIPAFWIPRYHTVCDWNEMKLN